MGNDRILIVEDAEETRHHLSALLSKHGYRVDEARDGLAALRKTSTIDYGAILLDLVLPHVDGWQFRDTQLRHPALAAIPTIVITVRSLREPDRYALRTPHILAKPIDDEALLALVRSACAPPAPAPTAEDPAESGLLWSRRGDVACPAHAPVPGTDAWTADRWARIPAGAGRDRVVYQCQYCAGPGGPIHRRRR